MPLHYQAVLLCGGAGSQLYPLNSAGTPKVLLPVGNQPLLVYPLRTLEEAGLQDVLVVVAGEAAAQKIQSWITKNYQGKLHLQVKSVAEDSDTAEALRAVADKIKDDRNDFVVISGDLVTDVSLKELVVSHFVTGAVATCLLTKTRTSPAAQTKPGKAPKGVDYIGLDPDKNRVLFADSSPDVKKEIRVPAALLRNHQFVEIRTDIIDQHLYIFNRAVLLGILESKLNITNIKQHLFPYLVRCQYSRKAKAQQLGALGQRGENGAGPQRLNSVLSGSLPDMTSAELASGFYGRAAAGEDRTWWCNGVMARPDQYCARVNTVPAYLDVNREVVAADVAPRLLGLKPSARNENFVHDSVGIGNKTTISAGCMVGQGSVVGDKSNIKRSVLGRKCTVGNNVKIINSVLMDNVVVDASCQVQNSVICSGVRLQERVMLRECQVGPDYTVPEGSDLRGEELAKSKRVSGEQSRAVLL